MAKIFAIKDVAKGTFKEIGNPSSTISLEYANDCTLELTGEESFARKNGNNCVSFGGARSGTFTVNTEMISMDVLALMLGGEYDSVANKISVKGTFAPKSFTFEGAVNVKFEGETKTFQFMNPSAIGTFLFLDEVKSPQKKAEEIKKTPKASIADVIEKKKPPLKGHRSRQATLVSVRNAKV